MRRALVPNAILLLSAWSSLASTGLTRYDVEIDSPSISAAIFGHMIFDDSATVPGNIWSSLIDWEFNVEGFIC